MGEDPPPLAAVHAGFGRPRYFQLGRYALERQADTAETRAGVLRNIHKSEVQSCRQFNGDRIRHRFQFLNFRIIGPCNYVILFHRQRKYGRPPAVKKQGASTMSEGKERKPERVYSEDEIVSKLKAELPHWRYENGWIRRKYKTPGWKSTLMLINTV